jgi:AraC family transcriptional regulator, transcriptional activator of pobA
LSGTKEIKEHTLSEILQTLGEDVHNAVEFHAFYNETKNLDNFYPYPFRNINLGLLLVIHGKMKVRINLETFIISSNDIIILNSKYIIQFLEVIEPVKIISVVFTEEYALKNTLNFKDIGGLRFFEMNNMPVLSLQNDYIQSVAQLMHTLYLLNSKVNALGLYQKEKIYHYFNLLALEIIESYREQTQSIDIKNVRKREVIQSFLNLLSNHVLTQRSVQFYADALFITPGHLTKVLKEASGITAKEIIEEYVVLEARFLLLDSSLSLAQISEKLNFSDPSFFGKFFKKKLKITPNAYRNSFKVSEAKKYKKTS